MRVWMVKVVWVEYKGSDCWIMGGVPITLMTSTHPSALYLINYNERLDDAVQLDPAAESYRSGNVKILGWFYSTLSKGKIWLLIAQTLWDLSRWKKWKWKWKVIISTCVKITNCLKCFMWLKLVNLKNLHSLLTFSLWPHNSNTRDLMSLYNPSSCP